MHGIFYIPIVENAYPNHPRHDCFPPRFSPRLIHLPHKKPVAVELRLPIRETVCQDCGKSVSRRRKLCAECNQKRRDKRWKELRELRRGPMPDDAKQKSSRRMKEHRAAIRNWDSSQLPEWLNEDFYKSKIQPALTKMSARELAKAIGVRPAYISGM